MTYFSAPSIDANSSNNASRSGAILCRRGGPYPSMLANEEWLRLSSSYVGGHWDEVDWKEVDKSGSIGGLVIERGRCVLLNVVSFNCGG